MDRSDRFIDTDAAEISARRGNWDGTGMDGRKFDALTRQFAAGRSRRSILKGLLGLGGAAVAGSVAVDQADARRRGTVTSPTTTTTTTASPCGEGEELCPLGEVCCPAGTCARSGNSDFCCDGTDGHGSVVCGLDCCSTEKQCCGQECCPDGTVCLAREFGGESSLISEEVCCPIEQTCDGQCCSGTCFSPPGANSTGIERECCPGEAAFCAGTGDFAGTGVCCSGEAPTCCVGATGGPTCLPEDQCCTDTDCLGTECAFCNENQCVDCEAPGTCCPAALTERPNGTIGPTCLDLTQDGTCCSDNDCGTCEECQLPDCVVVDNRTICNVDHVCCDGDCVEAECCSDNDCSGEEPLCNSVGVCAECLELGEPCNQDDDCCLSHGICQDTGQGNICVDP